MHDALGALKLINDNEPLFRQGNILRVGLFNGDVRRRVSGSSVMTSRSQAKWNAIGVLEYIILLPMVLTISSLNANLENPSCCILVYYCCTCLDKNSGSVMYQ